MDGGVDHHAAERCAHEGALGHAFGQGVGAAGDEQVALQHSPLVPGVAQLHHGVVCMARDGDAAGVTHGVRRGARVGSRGHRRALPHVTAGREAEDKPCK